MSESFIEKRKRELREKNGGSTESASSFVERRRKELSGEIKTQSQQMQSDLLKSTLNSVVNPTLTTNSKTTTPVSTPKTVEKTQKTVDFKAEQAKAKQTSQFEGKLPAASLLNTKLEAPIQDALKGKVPLAEAVTQKGGGPSNASQIQGVSNYPQYDETKKRIAESDPPALIEAYANAMNYLTQGNPVGAAVSRSFSGNSGATSRDSTGNKTVDKITDLVNDIVTPLITPTGAPMGDGIIGGSYKAVEKGLSKKFGQSLLKGAEKVIPGSPNVVRNAVTEGLAGGIQGVGFGLQQGQDSGSEIGRNAALGIAAGGVLAGAGTALGEGIGALKNRLGRVSSTLDNAPVEPMAVDTPSMPARQEVAVTAEIPTTGFDESTKAVDQLVKTIEDRGVTLTLDDIKSIEEEVAIAQRRGMTGADFQRSMNIVADSFAPAKEVPFAEFPAQPVNKAAEAPIPARAEVEPTVTPKQTVKAEAPVKVEPVTEAKAPVTTQRGFTETLKASDKTPAQVKAKLNNEYTPITNLDTVEKANARLKTDVDAETSRIISAKKFDAEDSVVAQRLIDHYNKQGNYEMSVTIADKVAEEATKAGQFIQSLSVYDRLTPEGVLIRAKRIEKRVNETASKIGKAAKVTDDMAKDIVDLAGVTQKMTGVKDLSNNVIDILERAKSGEKLTPNEASQLERFVNESKQFIKETTKPKKAPKAPTAIKDKRVRDSVTSFLDAQEEAAKARLKAKGFRVSSTPLDIWADYAVIGAAKMGKNIVKFADWSESMIKDLGEDIRPHLNQLYESSKEAFNLTTKKITRQTISDAERLTQKVIKEKELTAEEAESLLNLAQRVSSLSGEAKRTASQDLQAILQSLDKPSFLRKVASVQTQAQLLNPKTQVRNVLGNELFYRLERINKYVSTPIDIVRSKVTGSDRTVTFRTNNQGKYWENFMKGGSAGWRGVNINGLETQFDLASPAFTGKYNPFKYTEKALGASLRSFDNAAYSRAVNKSLGELGTLDAINNGVKPTKEYIQNYIAKADENIMQLADEYGRYVTFQDNNMISKGLSTLKRGLNKGTTGSIDFGLGDLVLKYPKTPGALLMRALEYSPAGFIRSAMQIAKPLLRNGVEKNPAAVVQGLSRAIIGTFGLSGLGYYLIDNDILTGQASKDRDVRSLQSAAGQGAYQVNLSALERFVASGFDSKESKIKEGDLLYTYDWMQPVSIAISLGANTQKALKEDSKENAAKGFATGLYDAVSGSVSTLTEQSVLQGIQKAVEGYPGQTPMDKIAEILSDVPASFVPTLSNQIKQVTDNSKRETTDQTLLEQTFNKAQAKIPGLAGKLPKKYDTLGNEQKHYQNGSATNIFLNPGFSSRYKLSDEARMIVDLIAETGDEGIAPRVPNKKLDGTKLTGEQFSRLSKLQGDETRDRLSKVRDSLSTNTKTKKIKGQLTKSADKAKKQLRKEFPELQVKK